MTNRNRKRELDDYELWNDAPTMATCPLWVYLAAFSAILVEAMFLCDVR
jgi:hypothetical protein